MTFNDNQELFIVPLAPLHTLRNCDVMYHGRFSFAPGTFGEAVIQQAFGADPGQFQFTVTDEADAQHTFPDIEFISAPAVTDPVESLVFEDVTPGLRRQAPQVLAAGIDPIIIDTLNDTELEFLALVRPGAAPILSVSFGDNSGAFSADLALDEELLNGDVIYRGRFLFELGTFGEQVMRAVFGPDPGQFQFTAIDEAGLSHSFPDLVSGNFPAIGE